MQSHSLMPLRPTGPENTVICIPGAGGNVAAFRHLLGAIAQEFSVYGFQPRGIDLSQPPDTSVEDTARLNLIELAGIRKEGDLHLIGHSYGGLIAYEMAVQMAASGYLPRSLTMIDTKAPGNGLSVSDKEAVWEAFVELLSQQLEIDIPIRDQTIASGDVDAFVYEMHALLRARRIVSNNSSAAMLKGPLTVFSEAVCQTYAPVAHYPGRAYLAVAADIFKADDRRQHDCSDVDVAQWRSRIANLIVKRIPGNHFSMLKIPHVHDFANWWAGGAGT